jgi:DNA-binding Lrp family transcriptional regulator
MPKPHWPGDRQLAKLITDPDRALDAKAVAVALVLLAFANDSMLAWPCQEEIAARTRLSVRSVREAIKALEVAGLISRTTRRNRRGAVERTEYSLMPMIEQYRLDLAATDAGRNSPQQPAGVAGRNGALPANDAAPTGKTYRQVMPREGTTEEHTEEHALSSCRSDTPRGRTRRSRFCPRDFRLDEELHAWAINEGLTAEQVERELAKMRDHEFPQPKSDWRRVFRNWIRRATEAPRRQGGISYAQKAREETTSRFLSRTEASK